MGGYWKRLSLLEKTIISEKKTSLFNRVKPVFLIKGSFLGTNAM
jgi:hypothetical protein